MILVTSEKEEVGTPYLNSKHVIQNDFHKLKFFQVMLFIVNTSKRGILIKVKVIHKFPRWVWKSWLQERDRDGNVAMKQP